MKIAIVGTRGIPNHYGGFEQFADILSQGLAQKGHDISVYCSSNHKYKEDKYNGVKLVHKYDPENKVGTIGQFVYDLLSILHARKQKYDIIYLLGYTSSSVWQRLLKNKAIVVTNMDGLEWKRSKYTPRVKEFLKYAEKLAVLHSDYLISDSKGIQIYLKNKYNVDSTYFPYGSFVLKESCDKCLIEYELIASNYDILIARFVPCNNIEMILEAFVKSEVKRKLVLVGDYQDTEFGKKMYELYNIDNRIQFLGAIYDQDELNNLRYYSNLYFHGHSVGGTNPSLLEAMGSSSLICYHNNSFNKAILGKDGFAFETDSELSDIINNADKKNEHLKVENNISKINNIYSWDIIINDYENYFLKIMSESELLLSNSFNNQSYSSI